MDNQRQTEHKIKVQRCFVCEDDLVLSDSVLCEKVVCFNKRGVR